ncbi:MAG: SDR family oxidoreductase [Myxococcales bacterium]|nr:SDR family oxidoreductase [Myxococcales bacterium]
MKGNRVVVIAGCGYVGTVLGERLVAEGETVFGIRRSAGEFPPGIEPIVCDLTSDDLANHLPERVDALVYCAAADGPSPQAYRDAYVDGLENILVAASERGLQRVIFSSSTSVFGQQDGEWVDELALTEPNDFKGETLLEAESVLASAGCLSATVRFGGIYGPGRTRFLTSVLEGRIGLVDGTRFTNRIHRADCAGVLRHLLNLSALDGLYVGVDRAPAEYNEVVRFIAELGGIEPSHSASGPRSRSGSNKRCSSERLVKSGYIFEFPTFREGYAAIYQSMTTAS